MYPCNDDKILIGNSLCHPSIGSMHCWNSQWHLFRGLVILQKRVIGISGNSSCREIMRYYWDFGDRYLYPRPTKLVGGYTGFTLNLLPIFLFVYIIGTWFMIKFSVLLSDICICFSYIISWSLVVKNLPNISSRIVVICLVAICFPIFMFVWRLSGMKSKLGWL